MEYIYLVLDSDDRTIFGVYDEETFKTEYKKFCHKVSYSDTYYWNKYTFVLKVKLNTDEEESIEPKDVMNKSDVSS